MPFVRRMIVTDLDGTLFRSDSTFHEQDLSALIEAGRQAICRVAATGRSLFSLARTLGNRVLPVDYVVFSTGVGLRRTVDGALLESHALSPAPRGSRRTPRRNSRAGSPS